MLKFTLIEFVTATLCCYGKFKFKYVCCWIFNVRTGNLLFVIISFVTSDYCKSKFVIIRIEFSVVVFLLLMSSWIILHRSQPFVNFSRQDSFIIVYFSRQDSLLCLLYYLNTICRLKRVVSKTAWWNFSKVRLIEFEE